MKNDTLLTELKKVLAEKKKESPEDSFLSDLKTIIADKKLDEAILQKKMEYEFLIELEGILTNKEKLDEAIKDRMSLRKNEEAIVLSVTEIGAFAENGELDENAPANGITIRAEGRISQKSLKDYYGLDNKNLSTRERLIVDAAIIQAQFTLINRYRAYFVAGPDEDIDKSVEINNRKHVVAQSAIKQLNLDHVDFKLKSPSQFKVSDEVQDRMVAVKQNCKNQLLIECLYQVQQDYQALGRSKHQKEIDNLIHEITNIQNNRELDPGQKFNNMLALIEKKFNGQMVHFQRPFLNIGTLRTPKDFIKKLNTDSQDCQYPRLLAGVLQIAYQQLDPLNEQQKRINNVKIQDNDVYAKKITILVGNDNRYQPFMESLNKAGLSNPQIYRFYKGQDVLNVNTAKKIWPELKQFKKQELNDFLNGNQDLAASTFNSIGKDLPKAANDELTTRLKAIKIAIDEIKQHQTQQKSELRNVK